MRDGECEDEGEYECVRASVRTNVSISMLLSASECECR